MFSAPTTTTTTAAAVAQQQRTPSRPLTLPADQKPPAEEPPLESMTVAEQLRVIAKQRGVVLDGDTRHQATWVRAIQQHQASQAEQKTNAEEEAQQKTGAEEEGGPEERLRVSVDSSTGAAFIVEALGSDTLGLVVAQALAPEVAEAIFMGEFELDGLESFTTNGVEDGARLVVEVRQAPFTPAEALAQLQGVHCAEDFEGDGPPTETSVGLLSNVATLPEEVWVLLRCLPYLQRLSFYGCRKLVALPEGIPARILFLPAA